MGTKYYRHDAKSMYFYKEVGMTVECVKLYPTQCGVEIITYLKEVQRNEQAVEITEAQYNRARRLALMKIMKNI
jgi:hypothetical protein